MKYGSPFAFGIIATTSLRPLAVEIEDASLVAALLPDSCRSERTNNQLLPATIKAAARMTVLKTATCEFFTSLSSAPSALILLLGRVAARVEKRSKRIVAINSTHVRM